MKNWSQEDKQSSKFKEEAKMWFKVKKITSPPNDGRNIPSIVEIA